MNLAAGHATQRKSYQIERLFSLCFREEFNTILVGGATEPLYLPAPSGGELSILFYREDYVSSALHEAAHWCLAGEDRRKLRDFGYWYIPPSRNSNEQLAFEAVEVQPQALEWIFSLATGVSFHLSFYCYCWLWNVYSTISNDINC